MPSPRGPRNCGQSAAPRDNAARTGKMRKQGFMKMEDRSLATGANRCPLWIRNPQLELPFLGPVLRLFILTAFQLVLDLSDQWMWACQGTSLFLETRISTGKPGFETPTGTYYVNSHLKGDQMVGWYSPTDYYDEWVPWVSYFTNVGHAVHQGDASRPFASHGCVRVPYGTAETLWWWVDMWLRIEIVW